MPADYGPKALPSARLNVDFSVKTVKLRVARHGTVSIALTPSVVETFVEGQMVNGLLVGITSVEACRFGWPK